MEANLARHDKVLKQEKSLLLVLAAVDLAPVPDIADYIPKIQSALRLSGFPMNEENTINTIQLSAQGLQTQVSQEWAFYDIRKHNGIRVSQSRIIIETTSYTAFVDFLPNLRKVLGIFEIVGLMAIQRIGLRYINAIQPREGEEFVDYLHERLTGLRDDFVGIRNPTFASAFQGQTDEGTLSIRIHQPPDVTANGQLVVVPPDLTTELRIPDIVQPGLRYRLLDLDHQAVLNEEYSVDLILEILDKLHHRLGEAFRSSLQDLAYAHWTKR